MFTLKDQFKNEHRYAFPRPRSSVLIFADREGSDQLEDWVRPIYARYQDRVALDGVADLSQVLRFARGMVRTFFRGQLDYPVMLDWSGEATARKAAISQKRVDLLCLNIVLLTEWRN